MNVRSVTFDQLTSDEIVAWSDIQCAEPLLASPYFRPEFTQCAAQVRNDIEIAVLEDAGRPVGFLPFQRTKRNIGRPVAELVSDFQGVIAPANVTYDPLELLRGCGLAAFYFDHLLPQQSAFAPYIWRYADSPIIDLTDGMEAYVARANKHLISEYGQKLRELVRDVGPVRYVHHDPNPNIVATLLAWKREQYDRTGVPDIFDYPWVRNLLDRILAHQSEDFASVVSVLYAGDQVCNPFRNAFARRTTYVVPSLQHRARSLFARYAAVDRNDQGSEGGRNPSHRSW